MIWQWSSLPVEPMFSSLVLYWAASATLHCWFWFWWIISPNCFYSPLPPSKSEGINWSIHLCIHPHTAIATTREKQNNSGHTWNNCFLGGAKGECWSLRILWGSNTKVMHPCTHSWVHTQTPALYRRRPHQVMSILQENQSISGYGRVHALHLRAQSNQRAAVW